MANKLFPQNTAGLHGHGFLSDVVEIAAGAYHCLARRADNTVWAWGSNRYGQLGDGTRDNRWVPVQVQLPRNATITAIAAGHRHSLAIVIASGQPPTFHQSCDVWAWGENYFGQLGDGSTQDRQVPVPVRTARRSESKTEVWLEIAAGGGHSLARRDDGTLWAWGCNDHGQLGDGTTKTSHLLAQVRGLPPPGREISQIAAGNQHNLAIVRETSDTPGSVWAWGYNQYGQLGDGTMGKLDPKDEGRSEPVKVVGADLNNVVTVRGGWVHSLALCLNGTLWAWGDNFFGQLGNGGTTAARCTPSKVLASGSAWAAIAAGAFHNLLAAK
jgi:alpha-tubulin suppressor-like RCC1 family protein